MWLSFLPRLQGVRVIAKTCNQLSDCGLPQLSVPIILRPQIEPAGLCGLFPIYAELSSPECVRAGRDDLAGGVGPSGREPGEKGGVCQMLRSF